MTVIQKTRANDDVVSAEVVTRATSRLVQISSTLDAAESFTIALITLDNGQGPRRPNTFGPGGLQSLDAAITAAVEAEPAAIVITGKSGSFAAGADLGQLTGADEHSTAEFAALGQRVFGRLRDASVPTFALINGVAMGGGLELALHCDYRTVASNTSALALPEVFLGILPGWGGTQLLPRITGPVTAVTVIVENALNQNRGLRPADALRLGVVDKIFDPSDFQEQSLAWAAGILEQSKVLHRKPFAGALDDDWDTALARGKKVADARTHGAAPAPYRALELIERSRTTEMVDGLEAERQALVELAMTPEFRAGVYAFDLTQKRARNPVGAPDPALARPVTRVGVVGAGLMAGQLALLFARNLDVPVVMTDIDQSRLDNGVAAVHRDIAALSDKNRISGDQADRLTDLISGSLDYAAFTGAEFVIEAVFEEIGIKKKVFAELEKYVAPDAVLATNTSSLSVTAMAEDLEHPERVVGFHFFNPVAVMPLLEIVRGEKTDDSAVATALALAKPLKKGPILVKDATGFVVNRLLLRGMGEVLAGIDEGTPVDVADAALAPMGLPMSTLQLIQLTGPAVFLHVQETLNASFGERFPVSHNLRRIVDGGHRNLLTRDVQGQQLIAPEIAGLLVQGNRPSTAEQLRSRVLGALAEEARLMLDDGVVADAADIDLGMITGAGWPLWLGGITPYLDHQGVSQQATGQVFGQPK